MYSKKTLISKIGIYSLILNLSCSKTQLFKVKNDDKIFDLTISKPILNSSGLVKMPTNLSIGSIAATIICDGKCSDKILKSQKELQSTISEIKDLIKVLEVNELKSTNLLEKKVDKYTEIKYSILINEFTNFSNNGNKIDDLKIQLFNLEEELRFFNCKVNLAKKDAENWIDTFKKTNNNLKKYLNLQLNNSSSINNLSSTQINMIKQKASAIVVKILTLQKVFLEKIINSRNLDEDLLKIYIDLKQSLQTLADLECKLNKPFKNNENNLNDDSKEKYYYKETEEIKRDIQKTITKIEKLDDIELILFNLN